MILAWKVILDLDQWCFLLICIISFIFICWNSLVKKSFPLVSRYLLIQIFIDFSIDPKDSIFFPRIISLYFRCYYYYYFAQCIPYLTIENPFKLPFMHIWNVFKFWALPSFLVLLDVSGSSCTFSVLILESTVSPRSPSSFYLRVVFRN